MTTTLTETVRPGLLRRGVILPAFAGIAVIGISLAMGLAIGGTGGAPVRGIVGFSARSTSVLGDLGIAFGFGFAFAAGMVAVVNPCGFAMLPAYLGLYVGSREAKGARIENRLLNAFVVSAALGLGFVLLFGAAGIVLSAGAQSIAGAFPYVGLVVGIALAALGAYIMAGGKLYTSMASSAASRIGDPRNASFRGYFLFGISYALASLSCTLPVFLALVSSSLASGGLVFALGQFVVYALGMSFVILVLTLSLAAFKGAMVGALRRVLPWVQPVSAVLVLLAAGYIIFYWLTEGGLAARWT
ncbi:MAG: cytochrome c biogenesis protein CcdA [Chloroflexi bacterium]|nr:cytochrome c biogenesis protein CcdA [Chloroflexota bacterium]